MPATTGRCRSGRCTSTTPSRTPTGLFVAPMGADPHPLRSTMVRVRPHRMLSVRPLIGTTLCACPSEVPEGRRTLLARETPRSLPTTTTGSGSARGSMSPSPATTGSSGSSSSVGSTSTTTGSFGSRSPCPTPLRALAPAVQIPNCNRSALSFGELTLAAPTSLGHMRNSRQLVRAGGRFPLRFSPLPYA